MNNLNDEILELQRHINSLSPIIEKDYNALNENSTFADRFAATINKGTLEHKKRKLQELQRQAHKEYFEFRIEGDSTGKGTMELTPMAEILSRLQNCFLNIGNSLENGPDISRMSTAFKKRYALSLENISAGSFRAIISSHVPDGGLFDYDPVIVANNTISKTIEQFFKIMCIKNPKEVVSEAASLGIPTYNAYKDFITNAVYHNLNLSGKWHSMEGSINQYECGAEKLKKIGEIINSFECVEEEVTLHGVFNSISADTNAFSFITEEDQKIKGKFPEILKQQLKELHISPLDYVTYKATFLKTIQRQANQTEKITWSLKSAELCK